MLPGWLPEYLENDDDKQEIWSCESVSCTSSRIRGATASKAAAATSAKSAAVPAWAHAHSPPFMRDTPSASAVGKGWRRVPALLDLRGHADLAYETRSSSHASVLPTGRVSRELAAEEVPPLGLDRGTALLAAARSPPISTFSVPTSAFLERAGPSDSVERPSSRVTPGRACTGTGPRLSPRHRPAPALGARAPLWCHMVGA